jgi:hypothetical protein
VRKLFYLLLFVFSTLGSDAQTKSTSTDNQIWTAYFNQTRFSNKWGLWADFHLRTKEDFLTNFSTGIMRLGLTYYLADNTRLTAGYAFVNHFPSDNHKQISQPEHRPWQQVQWNTRYSKLRTSQAIRLEERFRRKIANDEALGEGYLFNYRLRYNFLLSVPLSKKAFEPGSFAFVFNDEVHVNFGNEVVYNYFDQNRLFLGFSYQTNKTDNIQFGYMNFFQQQAAGNRYRIINALRVFYFHNLDLRRQSQ